MCRNIKMLHNFDPPATDEEIHLSSLQFVRKLSGFTRPSKANASRLRPGGRQGIARAARELIDSLVTDAPPRNREVEAVKPARGLPSASARMTVRARNQTRTSALGSFLGQQRWSC